ncbi:probable streptomycin biosynthesis operon possible regulatory protein [Roseobacter sp. AzwK-3b]|uniref:ParB N-terminal domain-containing protein n=1 Tax=Roseobacter sp. AzwK-3b TaxID=351016 RepID=UPI0001568B0B|nr:ParB N-terminal domain-containing protein [Roseobacter sp. AzwK-3b]EDM70689.1 probable streptomycin biosynthesis operon possible regulatory protein [Roseobacter sp. AzwK-3b]
MIEISKIRTDGGTQSRAEMNEDTVAEYAEALADPDTVFPPIVVYYDGKDYWLADGFHRVEAWKRVGRKEVPADVRQGDRRRAILHSCGANSTHGLRRTNADKRRAVMTLLEDGEWSQWSDREIARQCGVSPPTVAKYRGEISRAHLSKFTDSDERKVERGGKTYTQNTANIGKKSKSDEDRDTLQDPKPEGIGADAEADAVAEKAKEPDPAPPAADPEPPAEKEPEHIQKLRREFRKLTDKAQEDDWVALRLSHIEMKHELKKWQEKYKALSAEYKDMAESRDLGPKVSQQLQQIATIKGARDTALANAAKLQRRVNFQSDEIKKLRRQLEMQETPLN